MKRSLRNCFRSIVIALVLLTSFGAHANHIAGIQMYYTNVTGLQYTVTMIIIGDCGSSSITSLRSATPRVCLYNGTTLNQTLNLAFVDSADITPVCTGTITKCQSLSSTIPGYRRYRYQTNVTLSGTSATWRFLFQGNMGSSNAGRSSSVVNITSPGSSVIQLCDTLNNLTGPNSSPTSTAPFTPFFCQSNTDNYNPGAVDPNADSLSFALVDGAVGTGATTCANTTSNVTYITAAGYSAVTPLGSSATTWSFNSATGQITFVPSAVNTYLVDYNIREFRGGVFVGNSRLETNFVIQACTTSPPAGAISTASAGTIIDSTHYRICQGSGPFSFHIFPGSPDPTLYIKVNSSGIPAGATFSVVNDSTTNPDATFSWDATTAAPGTYVFYLTYKDDQCPVNGTNTQAFTVTIDPIPAVTGATTVCQGRTTTLFASPGGGTWTSSDPSIATIDISSAIVTGINPGAVMMTYTSPAGCVNTWAMTVNVSPAPITGTLSVCLSTTTTLNVATVGGTWTSSFPTIGSIGAVTGIAGGISIGTTTISYTLSNGCASTAVLTVNAPPTGVSGSLVVCAGSNTTLTGTPTSGTWASSNLAVGTIGASSGVLTGVAAGTTRITYTNAAGCFITRVATVNTTPTINPTAATTMCVGATVALTGSPFGGTWVSSTTSVASVSPGGLVSASAAGTTTITYTITATGCFTTKVITVNPTPTAITPTTPTVCVGSTLTMGNAVSGGAWTSGNTAVATIGTAGDATGVAAGTSRITYAIGTCSVTAVLTVNPTPTINPTTATTLCVGEIFTVGATLGGGAWSSTTPSVATITTGVVTAVAPGTTTISYTMPTGCFGIKVITVNSTPTAITPSSPTVCEGSTITLSNSVSGGSWTSATPSVATVGSADGVVTGLAAGVTDVTYSIGSCTVLTTVTVNAVPAPITPAAPIVCVGSTILLSDASLGGTWASSTTSVATVDAGGNVMGLSPGTSIITYMLPTSCYATVTATVNVAPAAITPASPTVCVGSTTTLANSVAGGTWASGNTSVATIDAGGVVTGVAAGTADITYAIGTCISTTVVTVNALPAAIVPSAPTLCAGASITLSDATSGGTWSSGNLAVGTIASATGILTGIGSGTTNITYTLSSGCFVTVVATVSSTLTAGTILGPSILCQGSFALYTNAVPGGVWSTSIGNATIASSGVANGITVGTDVISYTVSNSCGTVSATKNVTVNASPTAGTLSGPTTVCTGSSITISSTASGGTWSATNGSGSINSGGVFTGVTPGVDTIRYTVSNGCGTVTATWSVTVNPLGSAGTISGPSAVCVAGLISLTSTVSGGVWSSSNTNATVGSTSGIVTGIFPGIDTITYTVTGACGLASATRIVTVLALPNAGTISGPSSVCVAASVTLTSSSSGGTWSASNGNATVGASSGVVAGVTAGTLTITYTLSNACGTAVTTTTETVNPLPDAGTLSGPDSVCTGATITLASTSPGGAWTSGNSNASVSGGIVTGIAAGSVPISYAVTNMCGTATVVKVIQVVAPPVAGPVSGPSGVCVGSGITLIASLPGGTWVASNSNATIPAPGIVLGATAGLDTIFYVMTNLCGIDQTSKIITVSPSPTVPAIAGPTSHCAGTSITLTNAMAGGNWTSSNMAVATVGLSTGIVTGLSAGIVNITYTVTNAFGCPGSATAIDTVLAVPVVSPITGSSNVCVGSTIALTSATAGGGWSTSDGFIATVDFAGNVTGVNAGVVTISYTLINVCGSTLVTKSVTVHALPTVPPISGPSTVCAGASITLTNPMAGGAWSSSDNTVATVASSTGVVTGVAAGNAIIIYTVTDAFGCSSNNSAAVSVNPLPAVAAITGPTSFCIGSTATLSNATVGGTWSSSSASIATIGAATGIANGIAAGTVTFTYSYTDGLGCTGIATALDTVVGLPAVAPISGLSDVCVGSTITLTNVTGGGTWSSSDIAIASVDASGIVTGNNAGTVTITYAFTSPLGCVGYSTMAITVHALPVVAPITGSAMECVGATTTLADATPGGTWSSADNTIATAGASGVITGISAGTVNITYTVTDAFGCAGTATVVNTVNALPTVAAITGTLSECVGGTTTLANITPGGVWSSSSTGIATITSLGVVTGVAAGTTTISYLVTDGFGCAGMATAVNTVNTLPAASPITGMMLVCAGSNTTLSDTISGGVWSSSDLSIATVGATTGIVTGVVAGTATISYVVTNACGSVTNTTVVTVNALPTVGAIVSPFTTLCTGSTGIVTNSTPGGTWSSSNPSVATVSSGGVVTGLTAGTAVITYTVTNSAGCTNFATYTLAVAPGFGPLAVVPAPGATLCDGMDVYMYVTPPTPGLTYQWRVGGVDIPGATNAGYTTSTPGSYSVIVGNGMCSMVLGGTTVSAPPSPVIGFNPPSQLVTGSYASYQWFLNGVAIPGATTSVLNFTGDGSYTVKVTDVNGCSVTSQAYDVRFTGTANVSVGEIKVYPNPASSMLYIDATVKVKASVLVMDGKTMMEQKDAHSVDISKLPAGMYMIMIYDENNLLLKAVKFAKVE
jgi:uncharacterized protein YjdB